MEVFISSLKAILQFSIANRRCKNSFQSRHIRIGFCNGNKCRAVTVLHVYNCLLPIAVFVRIGTLYIERQPIAEFIFIVEAYIMVSIL